MKYGCHDRPPYKPSQPVQSGWYADGYTKTPRMVPMPHVMTTDCQFTHTELGKIDAKCEGCKHKLKESNAA